MAAWRRQLALSPSSPWYSGLVPPCAFIDGRSLHWAHRRSPGSSPLACSPLAASIYLRTLADACARRKRIEVGQRVRSLLRLPRPAIASPVRREVTLPCRPKSARSLARPTGSRRRKSTHVLGSLSRSRSRVLWSPAMIRVPLCESRRDALGDVQFVCTRGRRCFPISRDLLCYAALGAVSVCRGASRGGVTPPLTLFSVVYRIVRCAVLLRPWDGV